MVQQSRVGKCDIAEGRRRNREGTMDQKVFEVLSREGGSASLVEDPVEVFLSQSQID